MFSKLEGEIHNNKSVVESMTKVVDEFVEMLLA
jgi:hypothetical protein